MRTFFKKAVSILMVTVLLNTHALAGISNFLNDAIIEIENPKAIESQERNYFWGGGFRLRTPDMTIYPITVTPPRLDAGCSGLDIVFGGFSFLNFDYLVQFLENVVQSAPAFAFSAAMRALCDSCESIMNKLNSLANQINSINFRSCQAAKMIGNVIDKWVGNTIKDEVMGGNSDSWLEEVNRSMDSFNTLLDKWQKQLQDAGCTAGECLVYKIYDPNRANATLVKSILETTYFSGMDYLYITRALFGDYKVVRDPNSPDDRGFVKRAYSPTHHGNQIKEFIKAMIYGSNAGGSGSGGGNNNGIPCTGQFEYYTFDVGVNGTESRIRVTSTTFCSAVRTQIEGIIQALKNRTALSKDQKKFLATLRVPAYKILNVASVEPALLDSIAGDLVNLLGAEVAYSFLSSLSRELNRTLVAILADDKSGEIINREAIGTIRENIDKALSETYAYVADSYMAFNMKMQNLKAWQDIEARILASYASHPIVGAYIFTKMLPAF